MTRHVLFICTGNICRSPIAAGLLRRALQRDGPTAPTIEVDSAGVSPAEVNVPAEAIEIMQGYGVDLASHHPKALSPELVEWADLILAMSQDHSRTILRRFADAEGKTFTLTEFVGHQGDIPDPFGYGKFTYESCAIALDKLVQLAVIRLRP